MKPDEPISTLKGIGPKTEQLFHAIGVCTIRDLLFYFPCAYERYPEVCAIRDLIPDQKNAVCIRVRKPPSVNRNSRMQTAVMDVKENNDSLRILWFRSPYIRSILKAGETYVFYGRVTRKKDLLTMEQPEVLSPEKYEAQRMTLQPVYSLTKGLSNRQVQKAVELALADPVPAPEYLKTGDDTKKDPALADPVPAPEYLRTGDDTKKDPALADPVPAPEYLKTGDDTKKDPALADPVPVPEYLKTGDDTKKDPALADLPLVLEYLPEDIRVRNHLSEYNFALKNMHRPADEQSCILARERFVFDEFFFFLLCMHLTKDQSASLANVFDFVQPGMRRKSAGQEQIKTAGFHAETDSPVGSGADTNFVISLAEKLPYELTGAQRRAIAQIQSDMRSEKVMQRLIQGDVGSGKTIVAFLAMLDCANSGYQSAIMAPTDVLARQHFQKLEQLCESLGCRYPVVLLTGSLGARQRREAFAVIEKEPNALIVGTHALIQENVNYGNLALVVTDEQHRFGVKQRESFSRKGSCPHILVMSATPIPRTLAIILYGDLDISVIDEVPATRKPVRNCVVDTTFREKAYRFIESQIREGHQAYVICPLVEASGLSEGENVLDYTERLKGIFPEDVRISSLHGKMKPDEKNHIMEDFLANRIQILVSTTVVEVGVDVSNATVMMIENAERFGLAQLHQLRGRVGRGEAQSYCIFMQGEAQKGENRRLAVISRSNDGFAIAGEDLKLRGPGDFFGIRQSGDMSFQLADIYQDADVMGRASYEVSVLMREDPLLTAEEHRALRERLRDYAGEDFALLNL